MLYPAHTMRTAPSAARRIAVDERVKYLDEIDELSLVLQVKHVRNKVHAPRMERDTTANTAAVQKLMRQNSSIATPQERKEDNTMQFKKGMIVVQSEKQATQRPAKQSEQQRIALFNQHSSFVRQEETNTQRRRYQRGMMIDTRSTAE